MDASEIEVRLGATWIDKEYIKQFMFELLEPAFYVRRSIDVNYSDFSAEWNITGKSVVGRSDINANMTYGTERANAYKILEDTLNLRDVRIYDTIEDADGREKRVLNSKETTLAKQKQQAIKDAFQEWICLSHFSASLIFCVTKVIKPNFLTYLTLLVHITYEFK